MALAGEEQRVAGPRLAQRRRDGQPPVGNTQSRHRAHALLHIVDDRVRILRARVVRRHHGQIGELGGQLAHDRALAPVAVAATAEHHDDAARCERAQCTERALERIGRVRVVTQYGTGTIADELHPPGHLWRRRESCRHLGDRVIQRQRARRRRQRVGHVEVAQQRQGHLGTPEASVQEEAAASRRQLEVRGADVGVRAQAEGDAAITAGQCRPGRIVDVHHLGTAQTQQRRQLELGGEVGLHRAVIVEMVAGEVGEDARRKRQPIEPPLVEAVG